MKNQNRTVQEEIDHVMTLERITRQLIQDLIEIGTDPKEAIKIVIGGKL
jgi:hypothetical protein